jgi:L-threonylcarbamoyladenylate synthase
MKPLPATPENLEKAAEIIRNGGVVIYPTETVYGIGCNPADPAAAQRVCGNKGRDGKPLPLISSDADEARRIVQFTPAAAKLARKFWPGPLTLVLRAKVQYSRWVTQGLDTLAVRVPGTKIPRTLADLSGGTIVSTSTNRTGEPPAMTAEEAAKISGMDVDMILDGGPSPGGKPSTILDITGKNPRVLRLGPVTQEQIMEALS